MRKQRKMKPVEQRFWEKVNKYAKNGCWEWKSSIKGGGYGAFFTHVLEEGRVCHGAHRFSWQLTNGEIPKGLWVLHKCDNRICVNPEHLFLGSREDNMQDCAKKKRTCTIGKSKLLCCAEGHLYTQENTRIDKNGHRRCVICAKASNKRRNEKQKAIRALKDLI